MTAPLPTDPTQQGTEAMDEIKRIDPLALATLTQPILLTDFSAVHEAAEHVLGHPVWTHQFPAMRAALTAAVLAQFPDMPTEKPADWEALRDEVRARYGETVEVRRGSGTTAVDPLDPAGFPEGMRDRIIAEVAR